MRPDTIFFRPADETLANHICAAWSWLLKKKFTLIGTSLFGDSFLRDEQGLIIMLDVIRGELRQIAFCIEEFESDLESESTRPDWVMEPLIRHMIAKGLLPGAEQCYAFRTPPALSGKIEPENLVLWNLRQYQTGLSSLFQQIAGLPSGTQIVPK